MGAARGSGGGPEPLRCGVGTAGGTPGSGAVRGSMWGSERGKKKKRKEKRKRKGKKAQFSFQLFLSFFLSFFLFFFFFPPFARALTPPCGRTALLPWFSASSPRLNCSFNESLDRAGRRRRGGRPGPTRADRAGPAGSDGAGPIRARGAARPRAEAEVGPTAGRRGALPAHAAAVLIRGER